MKMSAVCVVTLVLCSVWQWNIAAGQVAVKPGRWKLLVQNGGVSAMHMATTHFNTIVMFDRTIFGPSQLMLDNGRCRDNPKDSVLTHDCTAHSIEYNIGSNQLRPLFIFTDTWCSSGAFATNGTLVQTGGSADVGSDIRYFTPCSGGNCDWENSQPTKLATDPWYASNKILPDNRIIVVGGNTKFNYEFVPKSPGEGVFNLPFLSQTVTTAQAQNNLYPFLHLSSDGNLFIFANRDSILLDYKNNVVVKSFPIMPGDGPRNHPSTGSSVILPLTAADGFTKVEVFICGGSPDNGFASANAGNFIDALRSCGRIVITDPSPSWSMEDMPGPRIMSDMLILPNGEVIIITGARNGVAGWGMANASVSTPYLYRPAAPVGQRFFTLAVTTISRMYHSTANVLPDGGVFVGGSNPHFSYVFTGTPFPTELRLEAYSPYYLENVYTKLYRPKIKSVSSSTTSISYKASVKVVFSVPTSLTNVVSFNVFAPFFTTHALSMNQRLLSLEATTPALVSNKTGNFLYSSTVTTPTSSVAAPPGYYMLFVVNSGIARQASLNDACL